MSIERIKKGLGELTKQVTSRGRLYIVAVFVLVVIVLIMNPTNLRLEFPGGNLVAINARHIQYDQLLDSIYSDENSKNFLMAWLANKDIFHVEDDRMASALQGICQDIPDEPLNEKLKLSRKCAEEPIAAELRDMANNREIPFHFIGREIFVGVPNLTDQPRVGSANYCRGSELVDREVQLLHPTITHRRIEITVDGGHYATCSGFGDSAELQLHRSDAEQLFPDAFSSRLLSAIVILID